MRTLIMPVGCPGSGKTYFCNKLYEEYGIISVSSDQMRENLYGDARIQGNGHEVFTAVYNTICNLFDSGEQIVILDATNVTRQTRYKAFRYIKPTEVIFVIMSSDLEKALENNRKRERVVPDKVLIRMYSSYIQDMPNPESDFGKRDSVIYHIDNEEEMNEFYSRLEHING